MRSMKIKGASPRPMAIPFKADHFRFRRQAELEKEISANPLFRKLDAFAGLDWSHQELKHKMAGGFRIPPGVMPAIDDAVLTLKTVARLPYEIEVYLAREREDTWWCLALLEDNRLTFKIAPKLLQECSPAELVYNLARPAFLTFQPIHNYLHQLLYQRPPFGLEDRLKAMELLRLGRYAAGCFALVCCGSLDTTLRAGFYHYTGLKLTKRAMDFDRLAAYYLKTGESNVVDILNDVHQQIAYVPIESLVFKRFQETESYRACRGETGGVSREQFESEVLEMDRQAYPKHNKLPTDQQEFVNIACLLAAYFVMEAGGFVTPDREKNLLEFFGAEQRHLEDYTRWFDWRRAEATNTEKVLDRVLTGRKKHWANLHSVVILKAAFRFAAYEHGEKLPKRLLREFFRLGQFCQLGRFEVIAVYESAMDRKLEEQERWE
jgi:hypothetical protein